MSLGQLLQTSVAVSGRSQSCLLLARAKLREEADGATLDMTCFVLFLRMYICILRMFIALNFTQTPDRPFRSISSSLMNKVVFSSLDTALLLPTRHAALDRRLVSVLPECAPSLHHRHDAHPAVDAPLAADGHVC